MSSLDDSDGILHRASGEHRTAAPHGTNSDQWTRLLVEHLAEHSRLPHQRTGNLWEQGRHIPGGLRTEQAEP